MEGLKDIDFNCLMGIFHYLDNFETHNHWLEREDLTYQAKVEAGCA